MQEHLDAHACHGRRQPSVNWGRILIPPALCPGGYHYSPGKEMEEKDQMPVCKMGAVRCPLFVAFIST